MIIGLVGKTASGKSTAAKYINKSIEDSLLIDMDSLAKKLYIQKKDKIYPELKTIFGSIIFDNNNEIDYKMLGNIVFNDKPSMEKLNKIMFPFIVSEVGRITDENTHRDIILDAAILFDTELNRLCNHIIFIYCPEDRRKELMISKNSGRLTMEEILIRFKGQDIMVEEDLVDYKIVNDTSKEDLLLKIKVVVNNILNK